MSSQNDLNDVNNNRRRQKKVKKEDLIKVKKAKGEEHFNHKGHLVLARRTGHDCRCQRYQCFERITLGERKTILEMFNNIGNKNDQDAYLMGLMSSSPTQRHISNDPKVFRMSTFKYKIRIGIQEVPVCFVAFCSIHGVGKNRIRRLQNLMAVNVHVPKDLRGKHIKNRPRKTPEPILHLIRYHISSFKHRQSHYSRRDNPDCFYLDEDLTIQKMYEMFIHSHWVRVSYIVYWTVFSTEFNLKFGLPRSDTCAICDSYKLKIKSAALPETAHILQIEHNLHLSKADKFREIKRNLKQEAQRGNIICISFDFMQNLPLPHIRTSDVFYSRQLWNFVFGIHDLGRNKVCMNSYLETEGRKGQNDVTSLLLKYFNDHEIYCDKLVLISDGCAGQNKNYVMINFLFSLVHILKLFKSIKYVFPIRGHTYLPNDQDFSLIGNLKKIKTVETDEEWNDVLRSARKNPSPFEVKAVKHDMFYDMKKTLEPYFLKHSKPAMNIKNVRMVRIKHDSQFVHVKYNFTGNYTAIQVRNKKQLPNELNLHRLYNSSIPLNPNKANDIKKLKCYISSPSKCEFYDRILANIDANLENQLEVDQEDNSSGDEQ